MWENERKLYPDIVAAGGLGAALNAKLQACGSRLRIAGPTMVESGPRFSSALMAANERLFLADFWSRGVMLAQGSTSSLDDLARAIDRWVDSECTTASLATDFEFVVPEPRAHAFEGGVGVEAQWRWYLSTIGERCPELVDFVNAAALLPELRQLFPYMSLDRFCFSRCTGYPYTRDTPRVRPLGSGEYEVVGRGEVLGRGNAEVTATLVVRHLPAGCGPALAGTAEDLNGA